MKTIKLQIILEVPDNYQIDEPIWTLEDAFTNSSSDIVIDNIKLLEGL